MEYKFVVPLYNLKISSTLNKGKLVTSNLRISNSESNFLNIFPDSGSFKTFYGKLEYLYLQNKTYIVAVGNFNELYEHYKPHGIDKNDHYYMLNALMRRVQMFCTILWLIKDNSVHTELGFITVGTNSYNPTGTSTGTAFSHSTAKGTYEDVIFTSEEIDKAIEYYKVIVADDSEINKIGDRILPDIYNTKSTRVDRAIYFLQSARSESSVPVKIMKYCTVLECLFTRDNSELTHKISERFAKLIGKDIDERIEYYNLIKKAYTIRSLVIHGQPISSKKSNEALEIVIELDKAIRILLKKILFDKETEKFFEQTDDKIDQGFLKLTLQ